MNEYDTHAIQSELAVIGYSFVDSFREADLVLVNTCAVRGKPVEKVQSSRTCCESTQTGLNLFDRLASHGAGVDKNEIGFAEAIDERISDTRKLRLDGMRVVLVHLTAECDDVCSHYESVLCLILKLIEAAPFLQPGNRFVFRQRVNLATLVCIKSSLGFICTHLFDGWCACRR